jgi:ribonuclease Z
MHLDDIIERADKFKNELIIAMHFSTRYATNQIERAVMKKLPQNLKDRVKLWL